MKTLLLILSLFIAAPPQAASPAQMPAGGVERFSKDGLSFDYPVGWVLEDKSSAELQHIIIKRPDGTALVMVIAQREPLQNIGQLFASRKAITEPYVEHLARQLGAKLPEAPDSQCLSVGESLVAGYRLAGRVKQEPSTAEVYPVVKGQRLVHLVYVRQDREEAAAAAAWKSVVDTLKADPPASPSADASKLGMLVAGGVLNGKVLKKPPPDYPSTAKRARASGVVVVQTTVDEKGDVISAQAVSGHPLLRAASEDAAKRAKFAPTTLCGKPVKVSGVITYNFVHQ